jgi:hypothetical protein
MNANGKPQSSNAKQSSGRAKARAREGASALSRLLPSEPGFAGSLVLLFVLAVLSAVAGVDLQQGPKVYVVGEIAGSEVAAGREVLVEDIESTRGKRIQVANAQPPVFDLSDAPFTSVENGVENVFQAVNRADPQTLEDVRWRIAERLNAEIRQDKLRIWSREDFQNLVTGWVLPWLEKYMAGGVFRSELESEDFKNGILVRDLDRSVETLRVDVGKVPDTERLLQDLESTLKKDLQKPLQVRQAILTLIAPLLEPSLEYNQGETAKRRRTAMQSVEPVFYHIKKGEVIVRQGDVVSPDQQRKLQALAGKHQEHFTFYRAVGIFIISVLLFVGLALSARRGLVRQLTNRDMVFMAAVVLSFGMLAKFLDLFSTPVSDGFSLVYADTLRYSLPIAGATGLLALFFPHLVCFFAGLVLAFLSTEILGGGLTLFSFLFLSSMFYAFLVRQAQDRSQLMKTVLPLAGAVVLAWVGVNFMEYQGLAKAAVGGGYALAGALISLLIVTGGSPVAEFLFGYTSRFKLMELMNLEQPLLQELMVAAPGTYHHSLVISNMVEAGARAVGANALLAKVAALYHDIGKLKAPKYFIENQFGCENPHDRLSPSMSALVLTSHVKKGAELARENRLGVEIEDIIRQHHGTMLISYFYHKAAERRSVKDADGLREEDYRYSGPRPQSREAGLILLADAVEASSRTLVDPTPNRVRNHIETIFRKIFSEGQLDECDLTLKDLNALSKAYSRILSGIFHKRIEYPEQFAPKSGNGGAGRMESGDNVKVLKFEKEASKGR